MVHWINLAASRLESNMGGRKAVPSTMAALSRTEIRLRAMAAMMTIGACAVFFLGCPGELENPERFIDGGIPQTCPDITRELFPQRCAGSICHEGTNPAGGLDLIAPDVEARDGLVHQLSSAERGLPGLPHLSLLRREPPRKCPKSTVVIS